MFTIVITKPESFDGEADAIVQMLRSGRADRIHIRKPGSSRADVECIIQRIPEKWHSRLVLHDHHDLAVQYALGGIHLNSRNPAPPEDWKRIVSEQKFYGRSLTVSRSCHTIAEVAEWRDRCDYVSLSPIFDSISKPGYLAAFPREEISQAVADGIIDEKVMALGGVTFQNLKEVKLMGFGGGMILGDAWRDIPEKATEKATERATERATEKATERATEKATERTMGKATERTTGKALERTTGKALERSAATDVGSRGAMKVVLTIAGSDTSAGAGIQQDLKTIEVMGHYAVTVPTALTAQNTMGVQRVMPVPGDMLRAQLESIRADISLDAVKIGMIPNVEAARIIVEYIKVWREQNARLPVVCDPVMVSTSGTPLMTDDCIEYIRQELFPICTVITPNIPEAKRLGFVSDGDIRGSATAALSAKGSGNSSVAILIKGGHGEGDQSVDTLFMPDGTQHSYVAPRISTRNLHGTGCTLSSAIATALATGLPVTEAVGCAKAVIQRGILGGRDVMIGHGNGPLIFPLCRPDA